MTEEKQAILNMYCVESTRRIRTLEDRCGVLLMWLLASALLNVLIVSLEIGEILAKAP